jgi:hypothetical protein
MIFMSSLMQIGVLFRKLLGMTNVHEQHSTMSLQNKEI